MPYEFAANIYVAYIKHNVYSSSLGCLCMEIHATVTITGAVGEPCSVDAYIVDKKGLYVTAKPVILHICCQVQILLSVVRLK